LNMLAPPFLCGLCLAALMSNAKIKGESTNSEAEKLLFP
jgi:hypothetical protein